MSGDKIRASGGQRFQQNAMREVCSGPLVTVITAVFNGVSTIGECIGSVVQQDYPFIEHIVIDGGSSDGTIELLRQHEDRIELWISEPDHGVYDAWNKGLQLARGEWMAFLGADDAYLPGAICEYMNLALKNPNSRFLSSRAQLDHPSGYCPQFGGAWTWPRAAKRMPSVHVGAMHRRSLFVQHGEFDSTYRIAGDYEFLLRARDDLHAAFTPMVTVVMSAGGLSDSTSGLLEARRAKIQNKIRSALRAEFEFWALVLRFHFRQMVIRVASRMKLFHS